jgi:hypothetical protein
MVLVYPRNLLMGLSVNPTPQIILPKRFLHRQVPHPQAPHPQDALVKIKLIALILDNCDRLAGRS